MELDVQEPWLSLIASGTKKVEGRLYNKKYEGWLEKNVIFYSHLSSITVKVKAVRYYDTLRDYLDVEGYRNVLPGVESYQKAIEVYHGFYTDKLIEERGGMVAIEVEMQIVREE